MVYLKVSDLPAREQMPGFHGRFIHADRVTIVHWDVDAGANLPEHSHPHEQVSNLIEGVFNMTIDGTERHLTAGSVAVVPSNAIHSGRAVTACRFIDVFQPVREDYR